MTVETGATVEEDEDEVEVEEGAATSLTELVEAAAKVVEEDEEDEVSADPAAIDIPTGVVSESVWPWQIQVSQSEAA